MSGLPPDFSDCRRQILQSDEGVVHGQQVRMGGVAIPVVFPHNCGDGSLVEGLGHEVVPIETLALSRQRKLLPRARCVNRWNIPEL